MKTALSAADHSAIEALIAALESASNAADGSAFAASSADDADLVNVRAEHHQGRMAIAAGHGASLHSIYAGKRNNYRVKTARALQTDVALAHVESQLDAPTGPLAGQHRALFSVVLQRAESAWQIASFHNTLTPPVVPLR